MHSSHFLLLLEPFNLQPGVSAHLSYPSCLTAYKAAPPTTYPCHSQGTAATLLPTAPSGPSMASQAVHMAGPHSLESSIVRCHLTFSKAGLRSMVFERINGHNQMPSKVSTCMHIRWDVTEAGIPSPVPHTLVTLHCQEKCFPMSHISTPGPRC